MPVFGFLLSLDRRSLVRISSLPHKLDSGSSPKYPAGQFLAFNARNFLSNNPSLAITKIGELEVRAQNWDTFFCWESRSFFGKPVVSNATCCRTVNDLLSWRTALTRPKCLHCSHKNVKLFEILSLTYSWPACVKPDKPECLPAASFNWTSIEINSVICLSVLDQGSCNASPTWRRVSAQAQQQDSLLRVGREIFSSFISSTPRTWQLTRLRCHSLKDWLQVEEGLFFLKCWKWWGGVRFQLEQKCSVPTEVQTWLQLANRDAQNNLVIPNCCYNIILSSLLYTLQKGRKIAPFGFALGGDHQKHCTLGKRLQMVCAVQYGWWGLRRMARSQLTMRRRNPIQTKSDLGLIVVMIKIVIVVAFANLLEFVPSWTDCMDLQRKLSNES